MQIEAERLYAVLTGDVIGSSRLGEAPRRNLHEALQFAGRDLRRWFGDDVPFPPAIFRGDSWQLVVAKPARSLRVGLYFLVWLRARMQARDIDTRFAIGIGTLDFIPGEDLSGGDGEAFRRSGQALERLPRGSRMGLALHPDIDVLDLRVILDLVDIQARRWSDRQARAIAGALLGWTQAQTARELFAPPISQQAIAQHLSRAGWRAISQAMTYFESRLEALEA